VIFFGINTGTSADAIDCVACDYTDGKQHFLDAISLAMPRPLQNRIVDAVEQVTLDFEDAINLSRALTKCYIEAAEVLLKKLRCSPSQVTAIGLHGQTIHHRPDYSTPYTVQLGDAELLASQLGIDVVDRFRQTDISVGGQGAPLIPVYHNYLARCAGHETALFINLGGIANITQCGTKSHLKGWDIGPANALMDLWSQRNLNQPFDDQGQWARSGKVMPELLDLWLRDPYFTLEPPKSTGRDYFSNAWLEGTKNIDQYKTEDIQASLCALTVRSIELDIRRHVKEKHGVIYIYGKGVHNTFLLEQMKQYLPSFDIQTTDTIGISAEWLEGGLFAWLAYCYKQRIASDFRHVTGAKKTAVLGACCIGS